MEKVDKDYIEHFNQGYELSKELGLKPNILDGIHAGKNRMQAMKDGMEQFQKDNLLEKQKRQDIDVIPPFDIDSIDDRHIHFDDKQPEPEHWKGSSIRG